ncbi:hypothetical protein Dsin_015022 [Dipteronia sinensis]|uniref:Uncharacterized protein n=1 Tax=Dipteronia sinensis TaxID=43782 RepID=A0AAE0AP81_9ROSI|nr:hypothetical protein Dsin_015022 [Dipteronia sinensis]
MGSKNCLIAWVILLLVYVLLLTSLVSARDLLVWSSPSGSHVGGSNPRHGGSGYVPP